MNSYIWRNLECEICKAPYSDSVTLKTGVKISLLNYTIHNDSENYVVIESVVKQSNKTIHVCNFDEQSFMKVGRA